MRARPTVYRGIAMRSRLEARYAAQKLGDEGWRYEPRCYADRSGQYLPDFQLGDVGHFVEVKPTREAAMAAIDRARIIFSSDPTALIWITWPLSSALDEKGWGLIEVTALGWNELSSGKGGEF